MTINYKTGLELWVWDRGELEGFAVYLNRQRVADEVVQGMRYAIDAPETASATITVAFGGKDGGATKIVDSATQKALEYNDDALEHEYVIVRAD
jgi:hypothetical protein